MKYAKDQKDFILLIGVDKQTKLKWLINKIIRFMAKETQ